MTPEQERQLAAERKAFEEHRAARAAAARLAAQQQRENLERAARENQARSR